MNVTLIQRDTYYLLRNGEARVQTHAMTCTAEEYKETFDPIIRRILDAGEKYTQVYSDGDKTETINATALGLKALG